MHLYILALHIATGYYIYYWLLYFTTVISGFYGLLKVTTVNTVTAAVTATFVNNVTCTPCLGLSLVFYVLCFHPIDLVELHPKANFV